CARHPKCNHRQRVSLPSGYLALWPAFRFVSLDRVGAGGELSAGIAVSRHMGIVAALVRSGCSPPSSPPHERRADHLGRRSSRPHKERLLFCVAPSLKQPPPLPVRLAPGGGLDPAPIPTLAGSIGRIAALAHHA